MIIGTVMLTMSYVYIVDSHMRVTILDQYLPTKINLIIRIYRWVVVLLVSLLFFMAVITIQYPLIDLVH